MSRRYNQRTSVYDSRPYHALGSSDESEEDDDVCVWKDGPRLSELYDLDVEGTSIYQNGPSPNSGGLLKEEIAATRRHDNANEVKSSNTETGQDPPGEQGNFAPEQGQDGELANALLTTRKNLSRMLQSILKLECRSGKVTKEGIRQTLDATVTDIKKLEGDPSPTHLEQINEILDLSESAWQRLYLIDRHWRRQSRQASDAQGGSPNIQLKSEPDVKSWLKHEIRINHIAGEDACYFTVADLANGRRIRDWAVYLCELCGFRDNPTDEARLIDLAWRFLDRNLRGPRSANPKRIEHFILQLEDKHERGGFDEVLKDAKRQEKEDEQAWKLIRKFWSSRI
ncbi:hypothetical protein F5Y05DRAFT_202361 [Hypoxylon sp. FL0543]|nr:hypothetical protein F5Y05DRAFT_202361 [Hypoxylon sp. FL0543]